MTLTHEALIVSGVDDHVLHVDFAELGKQLRAGGASPHQRGRARQHADTTAFD